MYFTEMLIQYCRDTNIFVRKKKSLFQELLPIIFNKYFQNFTFLNLYHYELCESFHKKPKKSFSQIMSN